jgi:hypothetical protein
MGMGQAAREVSVPDLQWQAIAATKSAGPRQVIDQIVKF